MSDGAAASKDAADPLVVNRRDAVSGPGMHVLVIGVSAYDGLPERNGPAAKLDRETFGLFQLRSAVTGACRLVEFLLAPPAGAAFTLPLKTCRLLLSPHATEEDTIKAMKATFPDAAPAPATKSNIIHACYKWRQDAETDGRDALTLFYFAGHGFQVAPGNAATMLPTDFAPPLGGTFSDALVLSNLENFMYGSQADQRKTPTHQYYFIDACRGEPEEWEAPSRAVVYGEQHILKEIKNRPVADRRKIARFFAANSGESGWGRSGLGPYFGSALRSAMEWAAVVPNERVFGIDGPIVTPESLMRGIEFEFVRLVDEEIAAGQIAFGDIAGDDEDEDIRLPVGPGDVRPFSIRPLLKLDQRPECRVRFRLRPTACSEMHVEFKAEGPSRSYDHTVYTGPVAGQRQYWSSPYLTFRARVWREHMDSVGQPNEHRPKSAPQLVGEKSGSLHRPADKVTLDWIL